MSSEKRLKQTVHWMTVNGLASGEVIEERGDEYLVRLPNGKVMIVGESSIRDGELD